jgi:hypothetical protein
MRRVSALAVAALAVVTAHADETPPAPVAPVERADALAWKATAAAYRTQGQFDGDLNLKRQIQAVGAWLGVFSQTGTGSIGRVGAEYDWKRGPFLVVPALLVATNGLVAGQVYAELGRTNYAIAGYSLTNLKPDNNLTFDPNDSVQLGLGRHLSDFDKVYLFTVFDVRLHTGQQDTHLLWRHRIGPRTGLTFDGLFKSGYTDTGHYVHAIGLGAYLDRPRWFAKAYYDPYANFSDDAMLRVGVGAKF